MKKKVRRCEDGYSTLIEDLKSKNPFTYLDIPQKLFTLGATSLARAPFGGKGVYAKPGDVIKNDWGVNNKAAEVITNLLVDPLNMVLTPTQNATKALLRKGGDGGWKAANAVKKANKQSRIGVALTSSAEGLNEVQEQFDNYLKNKGKIRIPAHAFGIDDALGLANLLGAGIQGFSSNGSAGQGELPTLSNSQIAGGVLSSAAQGATTGLSIGGPIGAGVGAVAGGVASLIGANNQKKRIRKHNQRVRTQRSTDGGLDIQAGLEADYYGENPMTYTFANGGFNPSMLAYVDDNEILRDLEGGLSQVPETNTGTDQHLIDSSSLESVLSDKLKVPGTKKSFAEVMAKYTNKPKTAYKRSDRFSEGREAAEKISQNLLYNDLLEQQEQLKIKKGIKPKTKGIPAFDNGTDWRKTLEVAYGIDPNTNDKDPVDFLTGDTGLGYEWLPIGGMFNETGRYVDPLPNHFKGKLPMPVRGIGQMSSAEPSTYYGTDLPELTVTAPRITPTRGTIATSSANKSSIPTQNDVQTVNVSHPATSSQTVGKPWTNPLLGLKVDVPTTTLQGKPDKLIETGWSQRRPAPEKNGFGDLLGNLTALAPTMYNWLQGMQSPEQEALISNPYSGQIRRSMAGRRFNVNPIIEANRNSRAIANYNANNVNPNSGMNMALRTQMVADEYRANADVYAQKQNADNQYIADYANTLNNLGGQYMQQRQYQEDINARNRAAARNYTGAAASQLGEWAQYQQQMRNQKRRDDMITPMLIESLQSVFPAEVVNQITANLGKKKSTK